MAEDFAIGRALVIPKDVLSNLDEVDKKINKIATDSENMAAKFTSAMSKMSVGTGDLLKKLTEMQTKINNIDMSKFAQGVTNVSQGVSQIEQFSKAITKAAAAINKYNSSQVNKKNVDNTKEINKLNKEIEALKKKTEQLEQYRQKQQQVNREQNSTRTNTKAIDAYNRAMASSEAIVTQRINKIAKLRQAEEMLTKASGDYSVQIKRIRQEIERLNKLNQGQVDAYGRIIKSQRNLMDTSGQLERKLALVFSVSQIEGYISKLVRVRGEFELQNTALASILQNKDQADKLFGQITELAVKSPFTLKELTTYTKSLSAYSVEYEKLYDTTKMLADVSAGLGVDMQRLILAFGQVKAANFLRGTETRQFTEAGINMLGELAKYYTELEGRIVSVGEVQERQFKKMISFADVEEVFKRLTSSGGMFYEMQEKQAETLWGMMSNLQDSIDIMLNDIGKANDGTIKDMITSIRSIVQNWREVIEYMKIAASIFGPYIAYTTLAKVASSKFALSILDIATKSNVATKAIDSVNIGITKLLGKSKLATIAAKGLSTVLGGIATLGVGAVLTAIVAGISYLYVEATKASRQAAELKKNLDSILSSGIYDASKLSTQFQNLANKILDSSTSAEKQNEALKELQRTYGEILPAYTLTIEGLKELKGNYDEVTKAIYSKIEAQTKEKQIQAVSDTYGQDVEDASQNLKDMLVKQAGLRPEDANYVINEVRKAIDEGLLGINDDYTAFVEGIIEENFSLTKNLKETSKTLAGSSFGGTDRFRIVEVKTQNDELTKYVQSAVKLRQEIENITSQNIVSLGSSDYRALEDSVKKSQSIISDAKKEVAEENKGQGEFFISEEQINKERELIQKWISDFKSGAIQVKNAYGNIVDPNSKTAEKFVENLQKQMDSLDGSSMQNEVRNVIREFSTLNDVSLVKLNDVLMESSQSMTDYKNSVNNNIKQIEERLQQYAAGYSGFITNIFNDADKKQAEQTLSLLKYIRSSLFPTIGTGGGESSALQRLKEQISLIKKAGDEYEKLIKYYSEEEATAKIRESFGDAFKNLGLSIDMTFDTTGIINGLESLYKSVGTKGKKILDESLATIRTQQEIEIKAKGVEEIQEQIDDLFAGYELSVELDKMGLDNNLISRLFDVNAFTLDDVRKNLDKLKAEIGDAGTKYEEVFQKAEEKITEMQQKELEERFKKYASYLEKSVDKISDIKVKAGVDIQYAGSLFSEGKIDANQYANILKEIIAEMNEEIGKINVNKFKESSEYIKAMGDLSLYSKNELSKLAQQIQNLISESSGKMNASDLKVYQDALDKINDRIREIDSPFKNNPFSQFGELVQIQKDFNEEKERYNQLLERRNQLEAELQLAKIQLEALEKRQEENPNQDFSSDISNTQDKIKEIISQIGSMNNQLDSSQGIMSNLSSKAGGMAGGMSSTMSMIDMIIKGVYQSINATIDLFNDFKDLMDSFGKDVNSGAWADATAAFEALGDVNENVMSSWESFKSGDMAGATSNAISAIFSAVKGINSLFDNKYEKRIQRQIELVENLQKAYEDLEKAIDKAYSIDTYKKATDQAIANLEAQNEALQAAIAAESKKKGGGDKDRIREFQEQMEDNEEAIAQLIKDQISTVTAGILDDGLSAADAFVDAWLEAFQETGDGLQGLEDNFNEMLLNMIKRQAAMSIVAPLIENMQKELEKYINKDDTDLTISEAEKFAEYVKNQLPEVSAALENLFNGLKDVGLEFGDAGDTMSSLQRGISSVSEETAQALEALLNSVRFFTSDSNAVLHNIYNAITIPNVENPFLMELKVQTKQLSKQLKRFGKFRYQKFKRKGESIKS